MNEMTTAKKSSKPVPIFVMVFIGMSASIWANGPDTAQRILLMLALFLAYSDIMNGLRTTPKNWLIEGLFAYYTLLMSLTLVVIVTWQSSAEFWEKAPKYAFGVILFSVLFGAYYAFKERGSTQNLLQHIPDARFLFGAIILFQIIAQVFIGFMPEASVAQTGAPLILLGFIAQPFAPSKRLPRLPFFTLKRISFMIVILIVLAEAYWP